MSKQFRIPSPKGLTSREKRARRFLEKFHAPLAPQDIRNRRSFVALINPDDPNDKRLFKGHGSAQQYVIDLEARRVVARAARKARRQQRRLAA